MNTKTKYIGTVPNGSQDVMTKIVIDTVPMNLALATLKETSQFTFSFYIKSVSKSMSYKLIADYDTDKANVIFDNSATTDWQKVEKVFDGVEGADLTLQFNTVGVLYIYHPKLEVGNKATDYSKNQKDVVDEADANTDEKLVDYTTLEVMKSSIDIAKDSILLSVSNTYTSKAYINGELDKLDERIKSAEIKLTPESIVSTVTSSETYKGDLKDKVNQTTYDAYVQQNGIVLNGIVTRLSTAEQKITDSAIINTVTSSRSWSDLNKTITDMNEVVSETKTTVDGFSTTYVSNRTFADKLKGYSTTEEMRREISNSANGILLEVSDNYTAKDTLNNYYTKTQADSKISTEIGKIDLSVYATKETTYTRQQAEAKFQLIITEDNIGGLISQINASADEINMKSNRFTLESTNASISKDGTIKAKNVDLTGKITATSGEFTGAIKTGSSITCGTSFSVDASGYMTAKSGKIGGWDIESDGISYNNKTSRITPSSFKVYSLVSGTNYKSTEVNTDKIELISSNGSTTTAKTTISNSDGLKTTGTNILVTDVSGTALAGIQYIKDNVGAATRIVSGGGNNANNWVELVCGVNSLGNSSIRSNGNYAPFHSSAIKIHSSDKNDIGGITISTHSNKPLFDGRIAHDENYQLEEFSVDRINHITWDGTRLKVVIDGTATAYIPVQWS